MTDADWADDLTLLTNTPAQAEYLFHSLEQTAAGGIKLCVNTIKASYTYFKQKGAISTLSGERLSDLYDKIKPDFF